MVSRHRLWALTLGLSACAAPSGAELTAPSLPLPEDPGERALATRPLAENPFVWRVRCPNRPGWGFLLGSIHVRRKNATELPLPIGALVDAVDAVAFEAEEPGFWALLRDLYQLGGFGFLTRTELDEATWTALETRLAPSKLKRGVLAQFATGALTLLVLGVDMAESDLSPDTGIESLVKKRAEARSEPASFLYMESAKSQIQLFADLPESEQLELLRESLAAPPAGPDELLDLYEAQDFLGLRTLSEASFEGSPEWRERILDRRNRAFERFTWDLYGRRGTSLVVAGA
ncbi:MAG: TraB/GumN family protein, partial [Myxococcota bacterium]